MSWDPEKYRVKREKVLRSRRKGLNLKVISLITSIIIILGISFTILPDTISWMKTRNLVDGIYKLEGSGKWPKVIVNKTTLLKGVKQVKTDRHDSRLIVTFNKMETELKNISAFFQKESLEITLLNSISHRQRLKTVQEERELEAL